MRFYNIRPITILLTVFLFQVGTALGLAPEIIPHRGGKGERPENIIQSFQDCVALGATSLELDVQVTKDGLAVVYHPGDLSANTDGKGKVNEFSYDELQKLDAAYKFEKNGTFPQRGRGHKIPLLEEVLIRFPTTNIIVDLKSLPADKVIEAVAKVAVELKAWDRLVFYSTDDSHLLYLKKNYPQAKSFESRKNTVEELLNVTGSTELSKTEEPIWLGFELVRQLKVTEKLALGDAEYPVNLLVWTEPGIKRIREKLPQAKFVLFGINTVEDYQKAETLGAYAVYSDNPTLLVNFRKTNDRKSS
jgi:glycerophosphoryl diester phosphodiesterase